MKLMKLDSRLPAILIDTSYFIFYRYYSTLKWYQFRNKEIDYTKIDQDETFMNAFKKHILDDLQKVCKNWKSKLSQIVFCCDCSREDIWRNEYTTMYKATRVPNPTFNSNIFFKFYEYIEENEKEWGFHKVCVDHLEADDIAYLVKMHLQKKNWPNKTVIITNDNDYLQMLDENTSIFNMNGKGNDLSSRSCGNPKIDLKVKLIMGDKSDNILPIHPGIGPKTAMKLAQLNDVDFDSYLVTKNCKEVYERNKHIVDLSMIPDEHVQAYYNQYEFEFTG